MSTGFENQPNRLENPNFVDSRAHLSVDTLVGAVATPSIANCTAPKGNGPKSWNYKIDKNSSNLASLIEQRKKFLLRLNGVRCGE